MDPFDFEDENRNCLRRNNGQLLNDALQIMVGIKPMAKPLGYQEKFDLSDLSKYIQDFTVGNGQIRGMAKGRESVESASQGESTEKAKLERSICAVRQMEARVETLARVAALTNQQLREIWQMQLNAQNELLHRVAK